MSVHFLMVYAATVFIASIIPGPSMLLALTHGLKYGARRTVASAMGNLAVTLVQAGVSIAGLGAMLLASETLFQAIKWGGAVYLVYIGISLFRSPPMTLGRPEDTASAHEAGNASPFRLFRQAALVTAGNPKAIVFFTAVFPQFMDPGRPFLTQAAVLLSTCVIIAPACFMLYAACGQKLAELFSGNMLGKIVNRVMGATFIGAGIGLAAGNR